MAERSVEEILGDIPRFKESCEQLWAWLQSQKPRDHGPVPLATFSPGSLSKICPKPFGHIKVQEMLVILVDGDGQVCVLQI